MQNFNKRKMPNMESATPVLKKSKPIKEEFTEMKNFLNNLEQEQELLGMSHGQQGKPS